MKQKFLHQMLLFCFVLVFFFKYFLIEVYHSNIMNVPLQNTLSTGTAYIPLIIMLYIIIVASVYYA